MSISFVKQFLFFVVIAVAVAAGSTSGSNGVKRFDVQTSDCEDCGMGILGHISIKLCGNGPGKCCVSENLDHPYGDDFNQGEITTFTGTLLGECDNFDLGTDNDWNNAITLYHSGMDGAQFDYVVVYTQEQVVKCFFHKFLDGNDDELGSGCIVIT